MNVNPVARSVQKVDLVNPGCGYTQPPGIRFIGDGAGAAATSAIGNGVVSGVITITDGGSGYIQSQLTYGYHHWSRNGICCRYRCC